MSSFMIWAALVVLAIVALGLVRVLLGPAEVDRMMSAQLVGTGGIAVLLLLAVATDTPSLLDVALSIALLSGFASISFVMAAAPADVVQMKADDKK
jgi:multicomponent Na+:H+ antiporter subunit F